MVPETHETPAPSHCRVLGALDFLPPDRVPRYDGYCGVFSNPVGPGVPAEGYAFYLEALEKHR